MSNIKYCRTKYGKDWYVFGFHYTDHRYNHYKAVYCYNNIRVFSKKTAMYIIEAPEELKELLYANNSQDVKVAEAALDAKLLSIPVKERTIINGRSDK